MKQLDLTTMHCPAPVVETRRALLSAPDQPLCVLVADAIARDNVARLASTLGYAVAVEVHGQGFRLSMNPHGQGCSTLSSADRVAPTGQEAATVVYVGNNSMGGDNRTLGERLMISFIGTLLELSPLPQQAIFVNEGVRLTTAGSPVLEPLTRLAEQGVEIVSCGLCLDFFNLKDELRVGRVGNMLETVEAFARSGRVIRP